MAEPDVVDLALQALSTPGAGAPDALEVLVDALLEAGILSGDGPPTVWSSSVHLRQRAWHWAKERHLRRASPTEQLVEIVTSALDEASLPLPILGVVGPFVLRLHYLDVVDAGILVLARAAVSRRLPASIVVEVTHRRG